MPTPNVDFDAILTTTLKNYRKQLTDNVFSARPLAYFLKRKDKIRVIDGGAKIVEPLLYAQNTTAGSYDAYDTLAITPQEGISAAEYSWKQYAVSIAISGIEEAKNNGQAAIINLLEAKVMQAEETITEQFDVMFFGDGTGNSNKNWNGLGNLVEASGTVGGINRATVGNEFWRSYEENTATALTIAQLNTAYNTVSRGNDHPDFEITTQTLFEKYEALLQPQLRFTDTKTADGGFQNLLHKTAPVMFDTNTPAGQWYFLNTKYIKLVGHKDVWFKNTDFVRPTNQDARYAQILCYGELTASNCARLGKLTAKTA